MRFHVQYSQYLFIYSIFDDFFTIIYSVLLYHIIYIQLLIHLPADASSPSSHRLVHDTPHFLIKIFNRMAKHLNEFTDCRYGYFRVLITRKNVFDIKSSINFFNVLNKNLTSIEFLFVWYSCRI